MHYQSVVWIDLLFINKKWFSYIHYLQKLTQTLYTVQKFGVSKIFLSLSLLLAKATFIWSKIFKIILPFKITVFCLEFISVIKADWIFSIISPVFSVTWSFRNHSNILMWCLTNIYCYYQCLILLCCLIFLWKPLRIFFQHCFMNRKFKRETIYFLKSQHLKHFKLFLFFNCHFYTILY